MCESAHDGVGISDRPVGEYSSAVKVPLADIEGLMPIARGLVDMPELRTSHVGFVGFNKTKPGDKVLIAVDREYDPAVPNAVAEALRERGARVDILWVDLGEPEREFDEADEIGVTMRRESFDDNPRRWEGLPFLEKYAEQRGYDLLVHGKGGPCPPTPYRYEQIPWLRKDHLDARSATYPYDVHKLINDRAWDLIWNKGKGGRFRLTDAEGTDLSWTSWDEYHDGTHYGYTAVPRYGHMFGHPAPPIVEREDAEGVVAGTTNHFSRPFPRISVELEAGQIHTVKGGGRYGDAWRDLLEEGKRIHYPDFPRPGLFHLWEVAIGSNPKIARPNRLHLHNSGGTEWERRRSGVIHMGFGTMWRAPQEVWAGERGLLYGHLHIHLLFPTLEIKAKDGREYTVIRNGRLTSMDDPDVRDLAAKHGDPDELLREDWIPRIPGLNAPGSYEEYARNPADWIYRTDI